MGKDHLSLQLALSLSVCVCVRESYGEAFAKCQNRSMTLSIGQTIESIPVQF